MKGQYSPKSYVPACAYSSLEEAVVRAEFYFATNGVNIRFHSTEPTHQGYIVHYGCGPPRTDSQKNSLCNMKLTMEWDGGKVILGTGTSNCLVHSAGCAEAKNVGEPPWRAVQVVIERGVPLGATQDAICAYLFDRYHYAVDPCILYEMRLKMKVYGCKLTEGSPTAHYLGAMLCNFWHSNPSAYLHAEVEGWTRVEDLEAYNYDDRSTWRNYTQKDEVPTPLIASLVPVVSRTFVASASIRTHFANCNGFWFDCGTIVSHVTRVEAIVALAYSKGVAMPVALALVPNRLKPHWDYFFHHLQISVPELADHDVVDAAGLLLKETGDFTAIGKGFRMDKSAEDSRAATKVYFIDGLVSTQILGSLCLQPDRNDVQLIAPAVKPNNATGSKLSPLVSRIAPASRCLPNELRGAQANRGKALESGGRLRSRLSKKKPTLLKSKAHVVKRNTLVPIWGKSSVARSPNTEFTKTQPNKVVLSSKVYKTHTCYRCGTSDSAFWSRTPDGKNELCNSCGRAFARIQRSEGVGVAIKDMLEHPKMKLTRKTPCKINWNSSEADCESKNPEAKSEPLIPNHFHPVVVHPFEFTLPQLSETTEVDMRVLSAENVDPTPNTKVMKLLSPERMSSCETQQHGNVARSIQSLNPIRIPPSPAPGNGFVVMRQETVCLRCETKVSPEWRQGPDGPRTLCNACGLYYAKMTRLKGQLIAASLVRQKVIRVMGVRRQLHPEEYPQVYEWPEVPQSLGGLPHPSDEVQNSPQNSERQDTRNRVDVPDFTESEQRLKVIQGRPKDSLSSRRKVKLSKRVDKGTCARCGTKRTPQWRKGPDGQRNYCNACGLWYIKAKKKLKQDSEDQTRHDSTTKELLPLAVELKIDTNHDFGALPSASWGQMPFVTPTSGVFMLSTLTPWLKSPIQLRNLQLTGKGWGETSQGVKSGIPFSPITIKTPTEFKILGSREFDRETPFNVGNPRDGVKRKDKLPALYRRRMELPPLRASAGEGHVPLGFSKDLWSPLVPLGSALNFTPTKDSQVFFPLANPPSTTILFSSVAPTGGLVDR